MMLRLVILGIVVVFMSGPLLAQEVPPKQQEESESEGERQATAEERLSSYVLVEFEAEGDEPAYRAGVTKSQVPLHQTPLSVGVVTGKLFKTQRAEVLGDTLRNVSGVVAHTGFGVFDFFTIRGFDSLSSGMVLTDGTPEPEVTFYHLYNVDRVEVLKGPGAFLYGGNPLAGSINLVRKSPVFDSLTEVGGSFGSFGTVHGSLDLNRVNSDDNLAFRLNTFGRISNGYRDNSENWQAGINPAVTFRLGQTSLLTLNFEYVRNEYNPDSGLPIFQGNLVDVPRKRSYQSPFDTSDQDVFRLKADFSRTLGHNATFRNKFYFVDLRWISDGTIFPAVFPNQAGSLDVYRSLLRLDDHQKLFGNQAEVSVAFQTSGVRHDLLAGFEVSRLGDVFTLDLASLPPIDAYDPVETARLPLQNIPSVSQAADTRSWVLAPYVLDSMTVSDRLRLFAGGRFDGIDFKDSESGLVRKSKDFSPMAGISYSLLPEFNVYANYGQGFAPPSSQVLGEQEPEQSRQFEVGGKARLMGGKIATGLAYYDLKRSNIAIPDEAGVQKQQGDQRSRGFELDFRGEVSAGMFLVAAYSYTDAELLRFTELIDPSFGLYPPILVDRSGNVPAFAPKHILSLSVLKVFRNGITLGVGSRYLSEQFIAPDNRFAIEDWITFDASLAYQLDTWRLSFNVKNLTGNEYETRGFGSTSVLPADPFAVYLGVDFFQ